MHAQPRQEHPASDDAARGRGHRPRGQDGIHLIPVRQHRGGGVDGQIRQRRRVRRRHPRVRLHRARRSLVVQQLLQKLPVDRVHDRAQDAPARGDVRVAQERDERERGDDELGTLVQRREDAAALHLGSRAQRRDGISPHSRRARRELRVRRLRVGGKLVRGRRPAPRPSTDVARERYPLPLLQDVPAVERRAPVRVDHGLQQLERRLRGEVLQRLDVDVPPAAVPRRGV
mmetsp:Transcript_14154/g.50886  ORF Transcript_14154/g.50886 Transcript_14154/m.50886 type:complete len:230 (+) Transcript_14154:300-989(+)